MSDEEVICTFCEPKPEPNTHGGTGKSAKNWWCWGFEGWYPRTLTLDALHEVEAKLTEEQWGLYREEFMVQHQMDGHLVPFGTYLLHATAAQKIAALAEVLDPDRKRRP